jgi:hypothetical protein
MYLCLLSDKWEVEDMTQCIILKLVHLHPSTSVHIISSNILALFSPPMSVQNLSPGATKLNI